MIHSLVFLVWISTLSSKDQEAELVLEEDAKAKLVLNIELANKKPWNGSKRNTMELSITELYRIFKHFILLNINILFEYYILVC
jgi:hypothetical protein